MFLDCPEINISVIVKHVQHVGLVSAFLCQGDLLSFSVPVETESCWFVVCYGSVPRLTLRSLRL